MAEPATGCRGECGSTHDSEMAARAMFLTRTDADGIGGISVGVDHDLVTLSIGARVALRIDPEMAGELCSCLTEAAATARANYDRLSDLERAW